jgi:hypothetical protein
MSIIFYCIEGRFFRFIGSRKGQTQPEFAQILKKEIVQIRLLVQKLFDCVREAHATMWNIAVCYRR